MFYLKNNISINARQLYDYHIEYKCIDYTASPAASIYVHRTFNEAYSRPCYGRLTDPIRHCDISDENYLISGGIKTFFNIYNDAESLYTQFSDTGWDIGIISTYDTLCQRFKIVSKVLNHYIPRLKASTINLLDCSRLCLLNDDILTLNYYYWLALDNLCPHEIFFALDIFRKLFTFAASETCNIIFHLIDENGLWNGLDVVALLYYSDYFNVNAAGDSLIGDRMLTNLPNCNQLLTPGSFVAIKNKLHNDGNRTLKGSYWQTILQHASRGNSLTDFLDYDASRTLDIQQRYNLPKPEVYSHRVYDIENMNPVTTFSDEYLQPFITYITFLKTIIEHNNKD